MKIKISNANDELCDSLLVRRRVDRHAEVNQGHATDDKGKLEEAYAAANPAVLFRYHATLLFPAHRVTLCDLDLSKYTCVVL